MVSAAALVLCALTAVDARLAPLYPLPLVYDDEPLALEIAADQSVAEAVRVVVTDPAGAEQVFDQGVLQLNSSAPRWLSVHIAGDTIGPFTAQVFSGEATAGGPIAFARIPRDTPPPNDSVLACAASIDQRFAQALYYMGIRRVLVNASGATTPGDRFDAAAECMEMRVESGGILRDGWQAASDDGNGRTGTAKARVECLTPATDIETAAPAADSNTLFIFSAEDTGSYRSKLETAGIERPNLLRLLDDSDRTDASIVSDLVRNPARGEARDAVVLDGLLDRQGFPSLLSGFRAASVRMHNARCVGETTVSTDLIAPIFCEGPDRWLVVLIGKGPVSLRLDEARIDGAWDAWNNPITLAVGGDGHVTAPISAGLAYVRGTGGGRLRDAAQGVLRDEILTLLALPTAKELLTKDFAASITGMPEEADTAPRRFTFFAALQRFPEVEARVYAGQLDAAEATPFLAALARVVRAACTLEQQIGTPFLEPVAETLARCKDYHTAYLGNAATGNWPRGDWIHAESGRLVEEARELANGGFPIEAAGVAAIAEWRARALQLAAQKQ